MFGDQNKMEKFLLDGYENRNVRLWSLEALISTSNN